tara:strand:- start:629 stop:826 length:198 start_codon:yes stop_codon:yes gene_type:complete
MTDSQTKQIRKHLEDGKTITSLDALMEYNCFRLSARIHELKQEGLNILREDIVLPSNKRITEYRL